MFDKPNIGGTNNINQTTDDLGFSDFDFENSETQETVEYDKKGNPKKPKKNKKSKQDKQDKQVTKKGKTLTIVIVAISLIVIAGCILFMVSKESSSASNTPVAAAPITAEQPDDSTIEQTEDNEQTLEENVTSVVEAVGLANTSEMIDKVSSLSETYNISYRYYNGINCTEVDDALTNNRILYGEYTLNSKENSYNLIKIALYSLKLPGYDHKESDVSLTDIYQIDVTATINDNTSFDNLMVDANKAVEMLLGGDISTEIVSVVTSKFVSNITDTRMDSERPIENKTIGDIEYICDIYKQQLSVEMDKQYLENEWNKSLAIINPDGSLTEEEVNKALETMYSTSDYDTWAANSTKTIPAVTLTMSLSSEYLNENKSNISGTPEITDKELEFILDQSLIDGIKSTGVDISKISSPAQVMIDKDDYTNTLSYVYQETGSTSYAEATKLLMANNSSNNCSTSVSITKYDDEYDATIRIAHNNFGTTYAMVESVADAISYLFDINETQTINNITVLLNEVPDIAAGKSGSVYLNIGFDDKADATLKVDYGRVFNYNLTVKFKDYESLLNGGN